MHFMHLRNVEPPDFKCCPFGACTRPCNVDIPAHTANIKDAYIPQSSVSSHDASPQACRQISGIFPKRGSPNVQ